MKYYSDLLKTFYDTESECQEKEKEYLKKIEQEEKEEKEKQKLISSEKKELVNAIDAANAALDAEYQKYEEAKMKAQELVRNAKEEAAKILEPAKQSLTDAQKAKYEAISNFNRKYGVYTTSYTGSKALSEYKRGVDWINSFFEDYFN